MVGRLERGHRRHPRRTMGPGLRLMRRRRRAADDLPDDLAIFRERDWHGRTWEQRWQSWRDARREHFDRHGWPGGALALLRDESDTRRRHDGSQLRSCGRTFAELAELDPKHRHVHMRRSGDT